MTQAVTITVTDKTTHSGELTAEQLVEWARRRGWSESDHLRSGWILLTKDNDQCWVSALIGLAAAVEHLAEVSCLQPSQVLREASGASEPQAVTTEEARQAIEFLLGPCRGDPCDVYYEEAAAKLRSLLAHRDHLERQRIELQARNTELVEERRKMKAELEMWAEKWATEGSK